MKPPFSYYGGKQRLASKILPLIPKHTVYVEPFAGSAAVMFNKPWPEVSNSDHYREVLNDLNLDIYGFYKCLQDKEKAKKLLHRLEFTLYSIKEHEISKQKTDDEIEKVARFFVNISMSFSNVANSGWATGVYSRNLAATWAKRVERLKDYLTRMQSVHIECINALDCIVKWDSPQTFFYCDPPYVGTNQGHYSGYTDIDLAMLVNTLHKCQGSFLLSSYDHKIINSKNWERFEFKAHCSSSCKGKTAGHDKTKKAVDIGERERTEIIWRRLNRVPVREEIQRLYDSGKYDCFKGDNDFLK